MVTLEALWLPILISAAAVWIASALAWTVAPHHKPDIRAIPDQDDFLDRVGKMNLQPGQYWFPFSTDPAEMKTPEMAAKMEKGPVGLMTVWRNGPPNMGRAMGMSVVLYLAIAIVVAYVTGRTLTPGADGMTVFRVAGTVGVLAHIGGVFPDAIWFGTPWRRTWFTVLDGVVYGVLIGMVFAAMWPG